MSDLESFRPGESGESYDPAAFERFKEQMKKNAAGMAAAYRQEQKQKEKEEKLVKILEKFIRKNQRSGLLMLVARLLKENIPASFILALILLGDDEIRKEIAAEAGLLLTAPTKQGGETTEFSLVAEFGNHALSLEVKARINVWGMSMWEAASAAPFRIFETLLQENGEIKRVVIDCAANVLDDFLKEKGVPSMGYETHFSFCSFLMRQILGQLKKQVENQKELS